MQASADVICSESRKDPITDTIVRLDETTNSHTEVPSQVEI